MSNYDSSHIKIFKGLEAVRKRPGMYIGNVEDSSGLHKMIFEVVDNSIDEYLAGECNLILINLHKNGSVTISDNGRGMPIDKHDDENISAAEVIMTILHSGAKFDDKSYKISGGLHGVGVSVVNALSKDLILKIFRNGYIYEQKYSFGKTLTELKVIGETDKRGTEITFFPDESIFKSIKFEYNLLFNRFKELSFLNSGIKIVLTDERVKIPKQDIFFENGGLIDFLKYINNSETLVNKNIIFFSDTKDNIIVNVAIQWIETSKEVIYCYTNNIFQKDGGSHFIGFKMALTKVLKTYIENSSFKKEELLIIGDDIRDGLTAVLSIYMFNPKFSSQIKDKLISIEAKQAVEFIVLNKFKEFINENPNIIKVIINKIVSSAKIRYAAQKAKDLFKKKNDIEYINLTGKLFDCKENNPALSELFLVEGDSAGGSAKQARDRKVQAILPLKGKILNVERSGLDKILSSSEIRSIISALRCGVGQDEYDDKKLRYHKIIFMTDADIDGAHIRTLLLTFFYRYMPKLIENGHIFICNPPLYRFSNKFESFYVKDQKELNDFLFNKIKNFFKLNFNYLDEKVIKNLFDSYKEINNIFDKYSQICPRVFFENFLFFDYKIPSFNDNNFYSKILLYEKFLSNMLDSDHSIFIKNNILQDNNLILIFKSYGVFREFKFNPSFFSSMDYFKILDFSFLLKDFFLRFNSFTIDKNIYDFYKFFDLISIINKKIYNNYTIQRYKGLGEMNPDQLWETSMNPKTRSLKVINIENKENANIIFSNLMGEDIESRKIFIDKNINSFIELDF